jgi:glycosyltransferase involved in cell wall biosynthesis
MRLILLADTYVPSRISGALQLHDLAVEMVRQGHEPLVVAPAPYLEAPWAREKADGVDVLRVRAPRTKDVSHVRRAVAEALLPYFYWRAIRNSGLLRQGAEGVVWYSPTIFLGPVVRRLRRALQIPSYLILRDVFPEWAAHAGVLRKGAVYRVLKWVERFQYRQASVIGVQTPSNVPWVDQGRRGRAKVEVLHNWLTPRPMVEANQIPDVPAGRCTFVYAGNMGVAQHLGVFIDLARRLQDREDIGFLFVGRGSDMERLGKMATGLSQVRFCPEIAPEYVPALLSRCTIGLVSLDPRHRTHNIPGKLLSYLHAGLPVLAKVNPGNDLVKLVAENEVGFVVEGDDLDALEAYARELTDAAEMRSRMSWMGHHLAARMFSSTAAVHQVVSALKAAESGEEEFVHVG